MLDKNERDGVLTKSQPSPTDNMVIVVWFFYGTKNFYQIRRGDHRSSATSVTAYRLKEIAVTEISMRVSFGLNNNFFHRLYLQKTIEKNVQM